jgi:membrane protein YdbS with pleckstrin-like domain
VVGDSEAPTEPAPLGSLAPPRPADAVLREPLHRVDPRARWYWAASAALRWSILIALQLALWLSLPHPSQLHAIALWTTVGLALVHVGVMPQWRYFVHRWEDTDTAIYTQSGWITQERRIAPIARIQTVDTHRGPLEQLFGLANVTVTTASAAGPLHIHGLSRARADQLVADLTARTQSASDDAT